MRFLHTSDWHLGRRFHGEDLIPAQSAFLDHLRDTARAENVDAILVAGDIYDRAIPGLDAVRLFNRALHQLADLEIPIVMISGNHDSAHRLGVGSGLFARAGIHLRTDPATCDVPVVLTDEHGPVAVYGVPYLEPSMVRTQLEAEAISHHAVLTAAMDRVHADLTNRQPAGTRSVVIAHAFVTPGAIEPKEREADASERDISVGGVAHVGAAVFDGIDYVALGHLHGPQKVTDRVHYSGSPLPYAFSEAGHTKSFTLVDLTPGTAPAVIRLPCRTPHRLERIEGLLDDLLADPAHEPLKDAWLEVTLTDAALPFEAMARLRRRFPHTLSLKHQRAFIPAQATDTPTYTERLRGRSELDIACDFITDMRGTGPTPDEHALLQQAVDSARVNELQREIV
ncbi:exonuclease SbcCD subunit D [Actinacidiphila glaucinigra]|uniref:Nuclease SbcCD subunit D n=1 Tax=Actinacidiphila glaucinigra TaxID=235986 RepID=A0A239NUS0_9ACTN|nr:exonuclease SbcCD subunit D [Actinacidiphila glaucinigra]SNT58452.1 Exodeoxyribonuclease I subunit D [Actinacidiphila glaucinigra]